MPENETSGGSARMIGRRTVVTGAAAALGSAAALTACADPATDGARSSDGAGSGSRVPGVPAAPGPPPDPSAGAGSKGTRLGPASDVPVGGGRVFEALEVVVTQPAPGEYRGFTSVCTHTGCNVTKVAAGTIDCPCHGSRFRLDGSVANGPAPRPLPARSVTVVDGEIYLA